MSHKYENRLPDASVNVTPHRPVVHFVKLMAAAIFLVTVLVLTLNYVGSAVAKAVPFRYELSLMNKIDMEFGDQGADNIEGYLAQLASDLSEYMPIPEGFTFDIHYNGEDTFNAFATLGGNLVFYRGLLDRMPNENALAMVLAHEMAHVIHRHPASGMGGGLSTALVLMLLDNAGGGGLAGDILTRSGSLTQLGFSRDMEREADKTALAALAAYYGHVDGATALFEILNKDDTETESGLEQIQDLFSEFSSTHPLEENRIETLNELARNNDWPRHGAITELPLGYHSWLLTRSHADSP